MKLIKQVTLRNTLVTFQEELVMKILLVEDNRIISMYLEQILINKNHSVTIFHNGSDAWENFINNSYDLVITDHDMPIMTGGELIKRIRKINKIFPIILMSGNINNKKTSIDYNTFFIEKPFVQELFNYLSKIERKLCQN